MSRIQTTTKKKILKDSMRHKESQKISFPAPSRATVEKRERNRKGCK